MSQSVVMSHQLLATQRDDDFHKDPWLSQGTGEDLWPLVPAAIWDIEGGNCKIQGHRALERDRAHDQTVGKL